MTGNIFTNVVYSVENLEVNERGRPKMDANSTMQILNAAKCELPGPKKWIFSKSLGK